MIPGGPKDTHARNTRFELCLVAVGNMLVPGAGWSWIKVSGSAVRAIVLSQQPGQIHPTWVEAGQHGVTTISPPYSTNPVKTLVDI